MKKVFSLMMVLAMVLASAAGFGETVGTPDLYDLYEQTAEGMIWIGTAVPLMDGVSVTSPAGLPETLTEPVIWDGTAYRPVSMALSTAEGTVLVLLHDSDGGQPLIPAYSTVEAGRVPQAGELFVRSGDRMKSRINRAVYSLGTISWKNREALLLVLSGDTSVGAPLLTTDGKLAGLVVAQYAEGVNRYVALPVSELSSCLLEASGLLFEQQEMDTRPDGYTVTVDRNLVTFDWSGMELPQAGEGETLYFILADAESDYLTYMEVVPGMTGQTMLLTPGRMYLSGLDVYSSAPDDLPRQMATTSLPEAEPLTDYGFRSGVFAIAELAEDAPEGAMPVVAEEVTEELLRSGRACIYSVTSYQVEQAVENCTLLIALTDPLGNNYRYESGWYYDPEIMGADEWYVTMEHTGLLTMLDSNGYPEGTYEMSMYIDGELADSFSFTLIK